jgi:hypothetical protein
MSTELALITIAYCKQNTENIFPDLTAYAAFYHWTSNWWPKISILKMFLGKLNPYFWGSWASI